MSSDDRESQKVLVSKRACISREQLASRVMSRISRAEQARATGASSGQTPETTRRRVDEASAGFAVNVRARRAA